MTEHQDTIKAAVDVISVSTAFAALLGYLPPLAALASLIWTAIQIFEWWKKKRKSKARRA